MHKDAAIALYDSGRGVESVLKACQRVMPQEKWLILQDTCHQPYGSKSDQEITDAGYRCFLELVKKDIKAIVVACHTSSAIALPWLQKHFHLPMVGMLRPTARLLSDQYKNDEILWLATPASVQADRLESLARHLGYAGKFHAVSCHRWVDCIEQNRVQDLHELLQNFVADYGHVLTNSQAKILYGCTHYPLLDGLLDKYVGEYRVRINPAVQVAESLHMMLAQKNILRQKANPSVSFLNGMAFRLPSQFA